MVASFIQRLISTWWFSLAINTYVTTGYKFFNSKKLSFHLQGSIKDANGINEISKGQPDLQDYFPTSGIETFISTIASRRMLLPTEYELSFTRYPLLKERYSLKKWPERRLEDFEDVDKSLLWLNSVRHDQDVERVLINFRKTVLGLEKYRINNPGRVAEQYCTLLKTCLEVPESWGAAANALEYAGLVIKDHVVERDGEEEEGGSELGSHPRPILVVQSLWRQACVRLLDIDTQDPNSPCPTPASENSPIQAGTWDQKFFSQVELTDAGRTSIQDMMLNILRVSVRCLLSREGVDSVDIAIDEFDTPGAGFFPPVSSVKVVMSLDRDLKLIEEGECSEEECEILNSLLQKSTADSTTSDASPRVPAIIGVDAGIEGQGMEQGGDVDEEDVWDMDSMDRVSTDTYVLFSVCDVQSTIEVQPRQGIFDGYMAQSMDMDGDME